MTFQKLFDTLQTAYETSTHNNNRFAGAISKIKWDDQFYADGEYYFVKDGHTLTTPTLDVFNMPWKPAMMPSDSSGVIEF